MFVPETNEEIQKEYKKLISEFAKAANIANSKDPVTLKDISLNSIGVTDSDNYEDIKTAMVTIREKLKPSAMIVIDSDKDICYVYKGTGSMKDIKKNILPEILESYEIVSGNGAVFERVKDVRHLMVDPRLN